MSEEKSVKKIDYSKNPVVLSASHVSKCFKLPTEQATGLKQAFINWTEESKAIRSSRFLRTSALKFTKVSFSALSVEMVVANQPCLS